MNKGSHIWITQLELLAPIVVLGPVIKKIFRIDMLVDPNMISTIKNFTNTCSSFNPEYCTSGQPVSKELRAVPRNAG